MDLTSIFLENKEALVNLLKGEIDLSSKEIDQVISTTQGVVKSSVAKETEKNGFTTLLNLFSDDDSKDSNSFLARVGKDLLGQLISGGMDKIKARSVKDLILPLVIKFISKKVGGNSDLLSSLMGDGSSGSNFLGNVFNKFSNK